LIEKVFVAGLKALHDLEFAHPGAKRRIPTRYFGLLRLAVEHVVVQAANEVRLIEDRRGKAWLPHPQTRSGIE
jgi:hypothetical protein